MAVLRGISTSSDFGGMNEMKLHFVLDTRQQLSPTQPSGMGERTARGTVRKVVSWCQDRSPIRVLLRVVRLGSRRKGFV